MKNTKTVEMVPNSSYKENKELFYVNIIKFLAILFVTGYHAWRIVGRPKYMMGSFNLWGFFENGHVGVEIFILISGFLAFNTWKKFSDMSFGLKVKKFYIKKILRIIPAYFIAIIVWVYLVNRGIAVKPTTMKDILSHMFFVHNLNSATFYSISGVFWYLGVQVQLYLMFPFIITILEWIEKRKKSIMPIILILLTLPAMLVIGTNNDIFIKSAVVLLPCFTLGVLLGKGYFKIRNKHTIILFLISIITLLTYSKIQIIPSHILRMIAGCLIGYTVINFREIIEAVLSFIKPFINIIAKTSYSIYLYNYIMYAFKTEIKGIASFALYIVLVFGIGNIMYFLVEEPLDRLIKKIV